MNHSKFHIKLYKWTDNLAKGNHNYHLFISITFQYSFIDFNETSIIQLPMFEITSQRLFLECNSNMLLRIFSVDLRYRNWSGLCQLIRQNWLSGWQKIVNLEQVNGEVNTRSQIKLITGWHLDEVTWLKHGSLHPERQLVHITRPPKINEKLIGIWYL